MGEDNKSRRREKSSRKVHAKLKKRKLRKKEDTGELQKFDQINLENDHGKGFIGKSKLNEVDKEKKKSKLLEKKKRREETEVHFGPVDELNRRDGGSSKKMKSGNVVGNGDASQSEAQIKIENSIGSNELLAENNTTIKDKSKKAGKSKKKHRTKSSELVKCNTEAVESEDIYHLSSGDDDCSKGMKKWLTEYHKSRPGLEILQQRIDDFITAHDAQEEKERKEREARAAEEGWTVVVHHKGKKRTTDSASGISVGFVAQAAVADRMEKKKKKEVALDFYNFQKREAQRNEVMMLQSKFEQDKKRIQQMRAARKFRPY